MKIISRYILRAHIGPFLFGFAVIVFIFLANFLMQKFGQLLSKDVSFVTAVELVALNIAWIVALAIPMAVLIATLMAFGRMSADNEITAMKASGYSIHQAMLPVLVVAGLLTVGLFFFTDKVLPDTNHKLEMLMSDIGKKKPSLSFQPGIFSDEDLIKDYSLLFENIDTASDWVYGVTILDHSDRHVSRTVAAEKATLTFNEQSSQMVLVLYNGEIHEVDTESMLEYKRSHFQQYTIRIPVESSMLVRSSDSRRGDRSRSIAMMRGDLVKSRQMIKNRKEIMINRLKKKLSLENDDELQQYKDAVLKLHLVDYVHGADGQYAIAHHRDNPYIRRINELPGLAALLRIDALYIDKELKYQNKIEVEIQKKYAIPVTCIVFVLIGVPLGVKARRGGIAVGGGLSLLFFLIHWTFLIGGEQLADRRIITPWIAMWAANILVGTGGVWMTVRMIRETTFLESGRFGRVFRLLVREAR